MDERHWAQVVEAATRAPSIHNTQPWLFTASPDRLRVFTDPARGLQVLDPSGRQRLISCGVAVEFAAVALRAAGHDPVIELLPDPADENCVATLRIGAARQSSEEDRTLAAAIGRRHTERAAFLPRPVPPGLVERLQAEAGVRGVWLKPITTEDEEVTTVFLISHAEEMEQREAGYVAELERWIRTDPAAPDGIPVAALPSEDPATRASNWLIRDFVVGSRSADRSPFRPGDTDPDAPPPPVERPTVVLVGTDNDDRAAWLRSGQALGGILLRATSAGLAASPLTQALDWPVTRTRMRSQLSLTGHPQMLLRLGYPSTQGTVTGRRPVSEVLRYAPA